MEILYWEKAFHAGKKNQENDFAPSENFPLTPLGAGFSISPDRVCLGVQGAGERLISPE